MCIVAHITKEDAEELALLFSRHLSDGSATIKLICNAEINS